MEAILQPIRPSEAGPTGWLRRMSRGRKRILLLGGSVALLILVACAGLSLLDPNRYKARFEAGASKALGMDVRVGGRISVGFFRGFHITVEDGRILGEQGLSVCSVKRARVWFDMLPLLRRDFRPRRI